MKGGVGMSNDFFRMTDIVKTYHMGDEEQTVLKHVNLTIDEGEFLSVLGPSGSGKSTLMNIIGCLDTPTSGEYVLRGRAIRDLDEDTLAATGATSPFDVEVTAARISCVGRGVVADSGDKLIMYDDLMRRRASNG